MLPLSLAKTRTVLSSSPGGSDRVHHLANALVDRCERRQLRCGYFVAIDAVLLPTVGRARTHDGLSDTSASL